MKKIIIIVSAILTVLIACACLFYFNWEVVIDLDHIPSTIEYNEEVPLPTAYLKGKYFNKEGYKLDIIQETKNDFSKIGTYTNKYSASKWWYTGTAEKEIVVEDLKAPTIELVSTEGYYTIPNEPYVEEGFKAFDEYETVVGAYRAGERVVVGIFALKGKMGNVPVRLADGSYKNMITGEDVVVENGMLDIKNAPAIIEGVVIGN